MFCQNCGPRPKDIRRGMPRFLGDRLRHNLQVAERFFELAAEIGCTPAQLSLAWVLSRGEQVVPIPGTTSIAHLEENLGALNVWLDSDITDRVEAIFANHAIQGARYSAPVQAQIDTETFPDEELA